LKKELEIPLIEISDKNARLDGGDVLFTGNFCKYVNMSSTMVFIKDQNSEIFYAMLLAGREFFVGLSHFTNEAGARAVAAAFPEYPCVPIKVI